MSQVLSQVGILGSSAHLNHSNIAMGFYKTLKSTPAPPKLFKIICNIKQTINWRYLQHRIPNFFFIWCHLVPPGHWSSEFCGVVCQHFLCSGSHSLLHQIVIFQNCVGIFYPILSHSCHAPALSLFKPFTCFKSFIKIILHRPHNSPSESV